MDDQDGTPVFRRSLWMALWFIVVVAVLWTLAWLIFFRTSPSKTSNIHGSNTNHSQSTGNNSSGNQNQNANNGGSSSSGASTANGSNQRSGQQLANAGAGNVLIPFAIASAAGATLYQVKLRKRYSK